MYYNIDLTSVLPISWLVLFIVSFTHDTTNLKNVNASSFKEAENQPNDQIDDIGFFTYDPNDVRYGPGKPHIDPQTQKLRYPYSQWPFVQFSSEQMYWSRKYGDVLNTTQDRRNECSWNGRQSPIDVCDDKVNKKCEGNKTYTLFLEYCWYLMSIRNSTHTTTPRHTLEHHQTRTRVS